MLVGMVGSKIDTLVQLALSVAAYPPHRMESSTRAGFYDGLRSALRLAGAEGRKLALSLSVSESS